MKPVASLAQLRAALSGPGTVEQMRERLQAADVAFDRRTLFTLIDDLRREKMWPALGALFWCASERSSNSDHRDVFMFHAGDAARLAGEFDLARDLMGRVIQRSNNAGSHSLYAVVLVQLGELDAALCAAKRSVEIDPAFEEGWFRAGEVCRERCEWEDAIAAFDKARQLDPTEESYTVQYAGAVIALEVSGVRHSAFETAESLLEPIASRGNDFWALIYWAQLEWLLDNAIESERALRSAMTIDPKAILPYTLLAYYLTDWERPKEEFDSLCDDIRRRADYFAERDPFVADEFRNALRRVQKR